MFANREQRNNTARSSAMIQRSTVAGARQLSSTSSHILQLQRSIGNRATSQILQRQSQAVIQRHLFVDTPRDFRQLEDLGMWWVMASEWKYQNSIPDQAVSEDPKDYITSLSHIGDASGKIKDNEQISMVAHGYEDGEHISVDDTETETTDMRQQIKDIYEDGGSRVMDESKFLPLHCYTGGPEGMWTKQGRDGLNDGPLLMPSGQFVSVDTSQGLGNWRGGNFITDQGGWQNASDALDNLPKLKAYKESEAHDGATLAAALDEVFAEIKQEYDEFVQELTPTGTTPNTWGV